MTKITRFLPAVVFGLLLTLVSAGAALADYSGWDSNAYFTHQIWEFYTETDEGVYLTAEVDDNPYGDPTFDQYGGVAYYDTYEGATGVWQFDDWSVADFIVPNDENENLTKEVWFQATYWTDDGGQISEDSWIFTDPTDTTVEFEQILLEDLGDGWYCATWTGTITPQPGEEDFTIFFDGGVDEYGDPIAANVYLDSVVIDTRCVPIPGAVWMLGSGLIGLVGFARRQQAF